MKPVRVTDFTLSTAMGLGQAAHDLQGKSALTPCDFPLAEQLDSWIGRINAVDSVVLPERLTAFDCRNHRLAYLALQQDNFLDSVATALDRYGAHRVGVILGTSTSGIEQTERAYRHYDKAQATSLPEWYNYYYTHNIGSVARFVSACTGASGYSLVISTACSSSNKVFASATRAMDFDLCDAVIVGGVDSLCLTTLCGFNALQLTSSEPCRPCDLNRDGISIGEAGGFALLEKAGEQASYGAQKTGGYFLGYGESSDAHHMSSPHPQGKGALLAMRQALSRARIEPQSIGYINLHGTGTRANDVSECLAVNQLFGSDVPVSSTKGYVGHTLGAAGIVEGLMTLQALTRQELPGNLNMIELDPAIHANVLQAPTNTQSNYAMSNSFGFGGNNCSLIFGLTPR